MLSPLLGSVGKGGKPAGREVATYILVLSCVTSTTWKGTPEVKTPPVKRANMAFTPGTAQAAGPCDLGIAMMPLLIEYFESTLLSNDPPAGFLNDPMRQGV